MDQPLCGMQGPAHCVGLDADTGMREAELAQPGRGERFCRDEKNKLLCAYLVDLKGVAMSDVIPFDEIKIESNTRSNAASAQMARASLASEGAVLEDNPLKRKREEDRHIFIRV